VLSVQQSCSQYSSSQVPVPVPVLKSRVPVPVPVLESLVPVPVPVPKSQVPVPVPVPNSHVPVLEIDIMFKRKLPRLKSTKHCY